MNLTRARFYSEHRKVTCFCCLNYDKKCVLLEEKPELVKLVIQFVDHGFNIEINSRPSSSCDTCLKSLYLKKASIVKKVLA